MKNDIRHWEQLAERYFQAETTDAEEQQLRHFLCTEAARDARFDDIRATMSLLSTCRPKEERLSPSSTGEGLGVRLTLALAACLCIAALIGWQQYREHYVSTVRVAGQTVEADASQLMQKQMAEVLNPL